MSPALHLDSNMFHHELAQAVMNVLIGANSECQPVALSTSPIKVDSIPSVLAADVQLLYDISHGFAEGKDYDMKQVPRNYY